MTRSTQGRASAPTMTISNALPKASMSHPLVESGLLPWFTSLQVGKVRLQLRQVETVGRDGLTALLLEKIGAENGVGLIAVSCPEAPGHGLQRAPGDHRKAAGVVRDYGNGMSAPGA